MAGYDFTGWTVDVAMSAAQGAEAVLRSTNGYTAACSLQADWGIGEITSPGHRPAPLAAPGQWPVPVIDRQYVRFSTNTDAEFDGLPPNHENPAYEVSMICRDTRLLQTDSPDGIACYGNGMLLDEDGRRATQAATIEFTLRGGGRTFAIPVVGGRYAARLLDPVAEAVDENHPYDYVVKDESGAVLGEGGR